MMLLALPIHGMPLVVGGIHQKRQWNFKYVVHLIPVGLKLAVRRDQSNHRGDPKRSARDISGQFTDDLNMPRLQAHFFLSFAQCCGLYVGIIRVDFAPRKCDLAGVRFHVSCTLRQ